MKLHCYIFLFLACSSRENKSIDALIYDINLNNNLILLSDTNFKILDSDILKDHGKIYYFNCLSNESNDTIIYLSYSLNDNNSFSLCNMNDSNLIKYKIAFADGLPKIIHFDIKNVQIIKNFKIGKNCFVKISYPQVLTWLLGTTENYSYSISIYKDTNDVYLNSLKDMIEKRQ
jgi:hypothetical protein